MKTKVPTWGFFLLIALGLVWILTRTDATDRRLSDLLASSASFSGLSTSQARVLPKADNRGETCNGQPTRVYGQTMKLLEPTVDYRKAAKRAAAEFERAGWSVERYVGGSISSAWQVEALSEDEHIIASYSDGGGFTLVARIGGCPAFGDEFGRRKVDAFPSGN